MSQPNGIYQNLPSEQYFAADRINNSALKLINKTPLHYKQSLEQQREETRAMMMGSAVHTAVLEPTTLLERYGVAPRCDKRTKEGKQVWSDLESTGKIILSNDDFQMIDAISQSVKANETAAKLLSQGQAEMTVYTQINGIPAKARTDWYRPGIIVDLKTTDDASPIGFSRSCATYGYAQQAAWYLDCCEAEGLEAHTFIFIVVEKSAPYAVAIYELTPESVEFGRTQYHHALNKYKECTAINEWPGYSLDIVSLSLPAWSMKEAA